MQPRAIVVSWPRMPFQSSPGPETGCNVIIDRVREHLEQEFQSSPGPETGCNGGPGRRPRVVCRIWGCFGPRRGAFARKTAAVALHTRAKPPILPRTFPKTGQHRRFARSHD